MEARIRRIEMIMEQIKRLREEIREIMVEKHSDEFYQWLYKVFVDRHFEEALASLSLVRERLEEYNEWRRRGEG